LELLKITLKTKAFTSEHSFTDIAVWVAVLTSSHWRWLSSCFLAGDSCPLGIIKAFGKPCLVHRKGSYDRVLKLLWSDGVADVGKDAYAVTV